jgi:hypothetical protein
MAAQKIGLFASNLARCRSGLSILNYWIDFTFQ